MEDLQAVALLSDPVRRALYDFVAGSGREIGREEAARAAGVQRTLAAFHLDKLVEGGLLESGFARLGGRSGGPGSGRPAKVYRRAVTERTVSVPPRDYRTVALVLAEVVDRLGGDELAEAAARRVGARFAGAGPLEDALRERGYEPYRDGDRLRLRNCPFHVLSEEHPLLVCSMNLALCRGLVEGLGEPETLVESDPRRGECCVSFSKNNED
ncbi:transcriptional regulator [Spongiactinospora sp. TRM90649]|uniref:helix-turn-helix transcriptional regulator n=1 Tax=Spongiactinospora sp. TRM90649 TaxID=3031114 RepID=UPI0023F6B0A7|nr:transcriptional regulator [Spongiactinospora sp. TRM90649]MDF5753831.1 transcriptional regulator [Spongiactinospora sp. TRM90649]